MTHAMTQTITRAKLPDERQAVTHKFAIREPDGAATEGYLIVGLYDDGRPGEIFLTISKEGTTLSGMADGFATSISLALQYGVPLDVLIRKFAHSRFEPMGYTDHPDIRRATSILDYIFRWLDIKYNGGSLRAQSADRASRPTQLSPDDTDDALPTANDTYATVETEDAHA